MKYYIADPHFNHESLNVQMDCRGFADGAAMNEYMIEKWNARVRPADEVYILGDLVLGKPDPARELISRLNGRLYLIQGNHDLFGRSSRYETDRFEWIAPYAEVQDEKRLVVLCHYPIAFYNGQYRRSRHGEPNAFMLYGHVHGSRDEELVQQLRDAAERTHFTDRNGEDRTVPANLINCFCMYSDYTPLTLTEWIANDRARRDARRRALLQEAPAETTADTAAAPRP